MQTLIGVSVVSVATLASFAVALLLECLLLTFLFRLLARVPEKSKPAALAFVGQSVEEMKSLASRQSPRVPLQ